MRHAERRKQCRDNAILEKKNGAKKRHTPSKIWKRCIKKKEESQRNKRDKETRCRQENKQIGKCKNRHKYIKWKKLRVDGGHLTQQRMERKTHRKKETRNHPRQIPTWCSRYSPKLIHSTHPITKQATSISQLTSPSLFNDK